jgi:hypothetical protein
MTQEKSESPLKAGDRPSGTEAWDRGAAAQARGEPFGANPFPRTSTLYGQWANGWWASEADKAARSLARELRAQAELAWRAGDVIAASAYHAHALKLESGI